MEQIMSNLPSTREQLMNLLHVSALLNVHASGAFCLATLCRHNGDNHTGRLCH